MIQQKNMSVSITLWVELNNTNRPELHDKCDATFKVYWG